MRPILLIAIPLFFFACKQKEIDKSTEDKALRVISLLDTNSIQQFKEWNYYKSGGDNWEKLVSDTALYTINYLKDGDTTHLFVFRTEWFAKEFECDYVLNHYKYYMFDFAKYNDSLMYIVAANNNGKDTLLEMGLSTRSVFKTIDPFEKMRSLNNLKGSLGLYGISYRKKFGNFIQFYISEQSVLTYLPESIDRQNDIWKKIFSNGKMIKPKWNLRML